METKEDRLSDLPGHVMDQILSFMPIKDAAKTCVLSTKWRYKWETVPSLVFDSRSFRIAVDRSGIPMVDKLIRDIDRVFILRSGPIHKFGLLYVQSLPHGEIDKWIRHVSKHSLQDLSLAKLNSEEAYQMPSCMFSCQNLTRLVLANCCLMRPPSTFKGFKHLKTLDLKDVVVAQDVLEYLISSSDVLSRLTLRGYSLKKFNINAPNLNFCDLEGEFDDISLKCTNLSELYMDVDQIVNPGKHSKLVKLMAEIPNIRRLSIKNYSITYLCNGDIPRELPQPYLNLYSLTINISLAKSIETSALLCLLRSAPNLQELVCKCYDEMDQNAQEAELLSFPLVRLRRVQINYCSGLKAEMGFIKFLLLNAHVLERMSVTICEIDDKQEMLDIVKQLCSFKRASPLVEVNISEK